MRLGNTLKFLRAMATKFVVGLNPARLVVTPPAPLIGPEGARLRPLKARHDNVPGLTIRALRKASRAFPTNRMGRSKYMPNGIPARLTKARPEICVSGSCPFPSAA